MQAQLDLLNEAAQDFRGKLYSHGAQLVWQAAFESMAISAKANGQPCENRDQAFAYARRLDEIFDDEYIRYGSYLSLADIYLTQANDTELPCDWRWEQYEYLENLEVIRDMIVSLPDCPKAGALAAD